MVRKLNFTDLPALFACFVVLLSSKNSIAQLSVDHPAQGFKFLGTSACVQCHKDGHQSPSHAVAGYEYTIWADQDPHACAYSSLFKEQSLAIARNLKLKTPPHKNDLCLNCHATNVSDRQLVPNSKHTVTDGVGCESCHGGAEQWVVAHTLPGWDQSSNSEKSAMGFVNTDNIATRARKCVECHVGSPSRDVNHDLIAAGHPRLYFEMAAYHAKMPRHWSRGKDLRKNGATTEYKLWLVGQYVSAAAALEQIQRRANNASSPWPEFAEYNCFSCHHDLDKERWKEQDVFAAKVATPEWGSWHFSILHSENDVVDKSQYREIADQLTALKSELSTFLPDRKQVVPLTETMKFQLAEFAESLANRSALPTSEILSRPTAGDRSKLNWDSLAQRYLAAVALRQARKDEQAYLGSDSPQKFVYSKMQLKEIREALKFIDGHDGPRDSNENRDEQLRRQLDAISQDLLK